MGGLTPCRAGARYRQTRDQPLSAPCLECGTVGTSRGCSESLAALVDGLFWDDGLRAEDPAPRQFGRGDSAWLWHGAWAAVER